MAKVLCVMGESGSGKTTSLRNLDPAKTLYIDCDGKGLSWRGWRNQYNEEKKNYFRASKKEQVRKMLAKVGDDLLRSAEPTGLEHISVIVVDTLNAIMIDDEFSRMNEKNFDKWMDLAASVYGMVNEAAGYREDLTIVFLAHSQTDRDESGFLFTRIKTSGRKLDKIVLESKFTTVLLAKCVNGQYVFETHANNSTAKTPYGMYEEAAIPNDLAEVLKKMEEY